jgi:arylsulfatase A-like enzyme
VSLVDVMPTVLDFVGLKADDSIDGRSFANGLRGGTIHSRPLFAMEHQQWWEGGHRHRVESPRDLPISVAVMAEGRLYSMFIDGDPGGFGKRTLANVEPPEHLRRLVLDRLRPMLRKPDKGISRRLKEELRALGYVQ